MKRACARAVREPLSGAGPAAANPDRMAFELGAPAAGWRLKLASANLCIAEKKRVDDATLRRKRSDQGSKPDEGVWPQARRQRCIFQRRARGGARFSWPERCRKIDDDAHGD